MGLYDFSRIEGFPSLFPSNRHPVTVDTVEVGWIFAFLILFASFLVILPGFRGKRRWLVFRVFFSILIGLLLMLGNFGMEWEVATLKTKTPYKAYTSVELEDAKLGMKLGLRGVNVTLYVPQDNIPAALNGETVNYNECLWWSWVQERNGSEPFAGQIQSDFRRAQYRGAPLPIVRIAEYFTFDGEVIRFGRYYMKAGWYTHIVMWAAFPCYLLAIISQFMVLRYSVLYTLITGLLQITACIIWAAVRNPLPLVIPFEDGALQTQFGVHFWLTLSNGIFCTLIAAVMDFMDPDYLADDFSGVDPLHDYYTTKKEMKAEPAPGEVTQESTANVAENEEDQEPTERPLRRRGHLPPMRS